MEHNFGKIIPIVETPNLTEVQRRSYEKFLNEDIGRILKEVSPIRDYNDSLHLFFEEYSLEPPKETPQETIEKNKTYAYNFTIKCRLQNLVTGEVREQVVNFGKIPAMTEDNIFILNGISKVIVNQIVRSPGIYYTKDEDVLTYNAIEGLLMPYKGAWMEIENDSSDNVSIILDRNKKILITTFLRAIGMNESEIRKTITDEIYEGMMKKDKTAPKIPDGASDEDVSEILKQSYEASVIEVFRKTRPGEPATIDTARNIVDYLFSSPERYDLKEVGRMKINRKMKKETYLNLHVLSKEDIIDFIKGYIKALKGYIPLDNIDHLANRRIKCVGELAEEVFRTGLYKTVKSIKEQMSIKDSNTVTPQEIISPKTLNSTVKEFFTSDELSQMLEETNGLSAITNKRRISAIGKGGLSKERAGFEVRDVHYSHYGRLCHVETPEGANIGLITSLAIYADIDKYGFIVTPYRKIDKSNKRVTGAVEYLTAEDEEDKFIAQVNLKFDESGNILDNEVYVRHQGEVKIVPVEFVDYMDISPVQTLSIAASMIPFVHNDDATRAAMGANMQRQALPLLKAEAPLVGTGSEKIVGREYTKFSEVSGDVVYVDADRIDIMTENGIKTYLLTNFFGTKKGTCIRETPIVNIGDKVKVGDPVYYKFGIDRNNGKLAIGRNLLVVYMPWEGYNYEDSILLNERMVKEDVLTSLHIVKYEIFARDTRLGPEEFTRDIPFASKKALENLDEDGIVKVGTYVEKEDILVGRTTPKGEKEPTPEERLMRSIFGNKVRDVKDSSEKLRHGDWGVVVDVKRFSKKNNDELDPGVLEAVHVYIAKKRKIKEGDKMAGRHGNKGVVSRILPEWEMPYMADGRRADIVLNPLGVPSRMNIGQILETHLGWAAKELGVEFVVPPFDGPTVEDIKEQLRKAGLPEDGKAVIYDGRTGEPFENPVTVGYSYMLRLYHLVDEKVHARSTGSYSLITQQPLGGKAQFGGQRFGEMEVWALEGYGARNTLQEMLTIKSDDMKGRDKTMDAILEDTEIPSPKLPESFKVLDRQIRGLALKLVINGQDDVVENKMQDLVEDRYVMDDEDLGRRIKPWKGEKGNK